MDDADPIFDARTKGLPHAAGPMRLSEIGAKGWRLIYVVDDGYAVSSAIRTCF